jgi:hypothetical protein
MAEAASGAGAWRADKNPGPLGAMVELHIDMLTPGSAEHNGRHRSLRGSWIYLASTFFASSSFFRHLSAALFLPVAS